MLEESQTRLGVHRYGEAEHHNYYLRTGFRSLRKRIVSVGFGKSQLVVHNAQAPHTVGDRLIAEVVEIEEVEWEHGRHQQSIGDLPDAIYCRDWHTIVASSSGRQFAWTMGGILFRPKMVASSHWCCKTVNVRGAEGTDGITAECYISPRKRWSPHLESISTHPPRTSKWRSPLVFPPGGN